MELKLPSQQTLQRYGLSIEEWRQIANEQNNLCFVCQKYPKNGRLCIDHFHVKRLEEDVCR